MAVSQPLDYNSTSPAAAADNVRNTWVADVPSSDPTVLRKVGTQTPFATATAAGAVPTPPNDATKFLAGDATWQTPSGGGGGGSSVLFEHYADAGSVTTGETDLYSDSISGGTLNAAGQVIFAEYGGTFVNSGSSKQLRAYFGGTLVFDSTALSISATSYWNLRVMVIEESTTVVRVSASMTTDGASLSGEAQYTRITGLTLSSANILKITGTGTTTNDVVASMGVVWQPSGSSGGGVGLYPVMTPPKQANFTWFNPNSYAEVTVDGTTIESIFLPNNSVGLAFMQTAALPSPPYTVDMAAQFMCPENIDVCYIALADGSGKYVTYGIRIDTAGSQYWTQQWQEWSTVTTPGSNVVLQTNECLNASGKPIFVRITDDGTNRTHYWSPDGRNFLQLVQHANNTYLTPTTAGILFYTTSAASDSQVFIYHWRVSSSVLPVNS